MTAPTSIHESAARLRKAVCSVAVCSRESSTAGYCRSHYRYWNRTGTVPTHALPDRTIPQCTVDECDRSARTRGWCDTHYARWVATGTEPTGPIAPTDLVERFWIKVAKGGPGECWLWTSTTGGNGKYGQFSVNGRFMAAHRFAYELLVGPIPEGLDLDHVKARGCRSTLCVNPAHLEPVTRRENLLRGDTFIAENAAKTHCPQGHPLAGGNLLASNLGRRQCRTCKQARDRIAHHARKASA